MGLFDIFKRRSKETDKQKPTEEPVKAPEKQEQPANNQENIDQSTTDNSPIEEDQDTTKIVTNRQSEDNNGVGHETDKKMATVSDTPQKTSELAEPEKTEISKTSTFNSAVTSGEQPQNSITSKDTSDHPNLSSLTEVTHEVTSSESATQKENKTIIDDKPTMNTVVEEEHSAASQESVTEPAEYHDDEAIVKQQSDDVVDQADQPKIELEEPTDDEQSQPELEEEVEHPQDDKATKYEHGLAKSRSTFGQRLNALFANFRSVDEEFFEHLEDMLIESDVGFETAIQLTDELRDEVKLQNAKKPKDVQNVIVQKMIELYDAEGNGEDNTIHLAASGPTVLLFVGVNGVGKTTTIGKLAKRFKDEGKKVLLVAADTFRAGAIEQLNVWAQRDGVDIVKKEAGSDPAASVFDGVKKAKAENYDILMVDTAGRLQNKVNLMNELAKMKKILTREIPDAPHEVLLVLDATTGQNAMTQAKTFKETTDVTGIVLTKLDGTAKGGIVLAIRNELHLPVKLVGLGEKVTDLADFDANNFVYGLFKGLFKD